MDSESGFRPPAWLIAAILGLIAGGLFALTNALFAGFSYGWAGPALFGALMFALSWARIALRRREARRVHRD